MIFLSHPYRHDDPNVVEGRIEVARHVMCHFLNQSVWAESWMVNTHEAIQKGLLEDAYVYWEDMIEIQIQKASKIVILCLPGWIASSGVQGEIATARKHDVLLQYFTMPMIKHKIGDRVVESVDLQ